jgi:acetyl esterase
MLDAMGAAPQPKLYELPIAAGREMYRQMNVMLDDNSTPVGAVRDLSIAVPGGALNLREYSPAGPVAGTLVWLHGGGFVIGDLDTHDGLCRRFCKLAQVRVIAVDYRMGPDHRFPAAINDCLAAWRWAHATYGGKLAVGGDSAGGNLAAVIAQVAASGDAPAPVLQILSCPWLDPFADPAQGAHRDFAQGFVLEQITLDWFRNQYVSADVDPKDPLLAPLQVADLSRVAPAYILTAEFDPLRDEGRAYAARLREQGRPVTYVEAPGMIHNFYCMTRMVPAGPPAIEAMAKALAASLQ